MTTTTPPTLHLRHLTTAFILTSALTTLAAGSATADEGGSQVSAPSVPESPWWQRPPTPGPPPTPTPLTTTIRMPGDVLFEIGRATLTPSAASQLDTVLTAIRQHHTVHVTVGGHTDNTGTTQTNQALSVQRAQSVRTWLIQQRIPPTVVAAVGYGETKPVATNGTPQGRANNRRCEITITATS